MVSLKLRVCLTMGLALLVTTSVTGQEKPPTHAPLVPDNGVNARAQGGEVDECNVKDALTREMIFTDSEKFASNLLVGTFAVANKYSEVRESPAMKDINVPNDKRGEWVIALLEAHHNYTTSSLTAESGLSSGKVSATLPPAAIAAVGLLMVYGRDGANSEGAHSVQGRSLRLGARSLVGSAAVSSAAVWSANSLLSKALPQTALELTLAEQKQIRDNLEQGTDAPAKFLGDVLNWNESQRLQFSRALNRKVVATLIKSAEGTEQVVESGNAKKLESRIVGNLAEISFVDIIGEEKLASESQLTGLKQLQELQDIARKLKSTDITPGDAKKALGTDAGSIRDRILALLRLHRLLQQTEKDLKPGAGKEQVKKLVEETMKAVETIRALCEVGK